MLLTRELRTTAIRYAQFVLERQLSVHGEISSMFPSPSTTATTVFVLFHFICVCVVSSSYYYYFLVFLCSLKALTRKLGSQLR